MVYLVAMPVFLLLLVLAVGAWPAVRWRVASSALALVLSVALVLAYGLVAFVVVAIPLAVGPFTLPFHVYDLRVRQKPRRRRPTLTG